MRMKFFGAIILLLLAVAEAHHAPEHSLRGSRFIVGKVHVYDVEFNVTSGVLGLSSQVSKSDFKAELQVYAKSEREHFLKITNVYTSGSVKASDYWDGYVPMQRNRDLEDKLSTPIKFTMENGEVVSYTLSPNESLESKKIKKGILRALEMHIPEHALRQMESSNPRQRVPVLYNTTQESELGKHSTHYLITVSPHVEFPYDMVYNVSRSENFEGERYYGYKFHHNFRQQGCSSVCKKEWTSNEYGAGCPVGYEPHQIPLKTYLHQQHNFAVENGVMTPEIIETSEVHTAKMYDQDMEVLIRYKIRKTGYSGKSIEEPKGQTSFTDLNDQETENENQEEIESRCYNKNPREMLVAARNLLREITQIVVTGNLERKESTLLGEKIVLLKAALSKLKASDFRQLASEIAKKGSLKTAQEEEKVKRQIWMDILPLIGTQESVSFVVSYIKENIDRELLAWEAKEILEALPENIHKPTEKNLKDIRTLLNLPKTRSNHLLHSATHLCLARLISSMCNGTESSKSSWNQKSSWYASRQEPSRKMNHPGPTDAYELVECPVELVSEIVKEISEKLSSTKKQDEIILYLETLTRTGSAEALPLVSDYAFGTAENIQDFSDSYIEFVKSAAIYSLHSIVDRHNEEVRNIVLPLFFNETESHKIRTAAFGVLIRSQPPLEVLQHVAERSWSEKSNEVGSFVTSTMETYGNATLPCMLLTAHRIKQVMSELKRFDIGMQHSKNLLWTYFDDDRMLGLMGHLTYIPSNETIIPSAIYQALSYSSDSLADTIVQYALNIQGLTQEKIFRFIDQHILGMSSPEVIPRSKENQIFEQAKIVERIPETLRFTLYRRMFYSSSYYYLDLNNLKPQIDTLKEYLRTYLMRASSEYSGHLVKVLLPSYFHTAAVAKSLPFPVEFQMYQPTVFALKVESKERSQSLTQFNFLIRPSFYHTKIFTNQLKNLVDCKEVGVYYEQKIAMSYPVQVKFQVNSMMDVTVTYKLPQVPKKIFYYFSEAGTYAGRKTPQSLPSWEDREPIRTLPSPFKNSTTINVLGLPPVHFESHSEEIGLFTEGLPSAPWEVFHLATRRFLNAGWRYRAANITLKEDSREWPQNTEVTLNFQNNRNHAAKSNLKMSKQQDDSSWSQRGRQNEFMSSEWMTTEPEDETWTTETPQKKWWWDKSGKDEDTEEEWDDDLKPDDITKNRNPSTFVEQGRRISSKLATKIPHISHSLEVTMRTSPAYRSARLRVEYNHTYSRCLHAVHVDASIRDRSERVLKELSIDHVMGFTGKPDEFQYDKHTDDHKAVFISALRSQPARSSSPWKDVEIVTKGVFEYEPLDNLLRNALENNVRREYFLSEHHDECLEDVKNGHAYSTRCLKAIRERSIYNKIRMAILWNENIPQNLKNGARRLDTYLKHLFYHHMSLDFESNTKNQILITHDHFHQLTDMPVFDVIIRKPEETITWRKVRTVAHVLDHPLSGVYDLLDLDLMILTNNTYPPTCVMMEKSIRTYDLKEYPLSLDHCNYILSTHCTEHKNFAIIAKVLSRDGEKEIHVHVGQHTLVMSPKSGDYYTIKYDGQDHTVSEPLVFDEETADIYVFSEKFASNHRHLEVVARKAGIKVTYDGKNVKVQVNPKYKGETCGLCSEFDGETIREYRGADRCLYSHPVDFVNSAITNQDSCKKQPAYPYICEDGVNNKMAWKQESSNDEYEPSKKRNIVVAKGNEVCFSIRPVPVCESDDEPTETESMQVGFHCLPRQDITARRMVSEAKRRSLGEIENKSVDYEDMVEVAKMC